MPDDLQAIRTLPVCRKEVMKRVRHGKVLGIFGTLVTGLPRSQPPPSPKCSGVASSSDGVAICCLSIAAVFAPKGRSGKEFRARSSPASSPVQYLKEYWTTALGVQ